MKYRIESLQAGYFDEATGRWDESSWSSNRGGISQECNDLATAERAFEKTCSLARFIWPCRVIDWADCIHRFYNPQLDERLPGCRWEIEQRAYYLWLDAGKPEGRSDEFWSTAKRLIEASSSNLGRYFAPDSFTFGADGDLILKSSDCGVK